MRRIGVLTALAENDLGWRRNFAGFVAGLREKVWVEGQTSAFEFRYVPSGNLDHLRVAAGELVSGTAHPTIPSSPSLHRFIHCVTCDG
jgi:hypothetical protein